MPHLQVRYRWLTVRASGESREVRYSMPDDLHIAIAIGTCRETDQTPENHGGDAGEESS
jgi:hypothetical protein